MQDSGATAAGRRAGARRTAQDRRSNPMTPAQWYCLLAGLVLLLAGIFGFISDASFDTGSRADTDVGGNGNGALQGDGFLGFEVNGWHNVIHIASGLLLLAAFPRRGPAQVVALGFGAVYGAVAIIGLIDGNDVVGLFPVNAADNVLHIALSAMGILTGLTSRSTYERGELATRDVAVAPAGTGAEPGERFSRDPDAAVRARERRPRG